ncbi:hypothetical protein [Ferrovum myxofaciens]|jgi:hypothetical protein|uniref:hypothetical protein n=1 Tax=Ferrovum myxofaciens TaxID=416213 RepID=UPI0012E76138|nr:hypothetical protein [Ferrovum myxofaciens]
MTRRDRVLSELERLVPWMALEKLIEPHYFSGKRGDKVKSGVWSVSGMMRQAASFC